ncbi:3'-5' exonuclease [Streptomyces sp. BV129]|uniref:3'-5' exonuclease n=1 Tax=Streptomyces sp. BV129 TaxID=2849671 RepID=UPI0027E56A91|nr:3'-5' exonuclease [Streptomyces sp. BV129]
MDALMNDPRFVATTLVVIDFEGLTPAGRPAEPIEVAVLALRPADGELVEVGRFEELMQPPADVPVTARDVQFKGITRQMLSTARSAAEVLTRLDAHLTAQPYRLVAHHASTEAEFIARQAAYCPVLAATPLLDTLRLAKAVAPGLSSYGLDGPARLLRHSPASGSAPGDAGRRSHRPGTRPAAGGRVCRRAVAHLARVGRGRRIAARAAIVHSPGNRAESPVLNWHPAGRTCHGRPLHGRCP